MDKVYRRLLQARIVEAITLTEEVIPNLKDKSEFDTTPDWLNYVIDTIESSIKETSGEYNIKEGITLVTDSMCSPAYKIREIFKNNKPLSLEDIKEIEKQVSNIKIIKNSFYQRETTPEKLNLYTCWSLYQHGASWNKIYELSDANYAWNSDNKDNVIRKLKRWSKNLGWERNPK